MIKLTTSNKEEIKVIQGKFPNGETYVDLGDIDFSGYIDQRFWKISIYFESNDDLVNLLLLSKQLRKNTPSVKQILILNYMPYSRMDREINGFSFSLKYVSGFINNLKFDRVILLEPHSNVSTALLDNCFDILTSVDVTQYAMDDIEFNLESDYILYPNAGAQKRYQDEFKGFKTLTGNKKRNLQDGKIISFEVNGVDDLNGANVIICDDLCSRGGTFLATANALQSRNVGKIYLAITHLENNVNTGGLPTSELIEGIYATNSIYTDEAFDKLTIVEVQ